LAAVFLCHLRNTTTSTITPMTRTIKMSVIIPAAAITPPFDPPTGIGADVLLSGGMRGQVHARLHESTCKLILS